MTETYAVKDIIDKNKAVSDLNIDRNDLDVSMMRQAGLFAYYSQKAAEAEMQFARMEQLQEIIEARLDRKVRDAAAAAGTKITEAQVKAQVALEPKAIAIKTAVNKARMVMGICKGQAEAVRHRRDMITQVAFNDRHEKKGELRVMEHQLEAQQNRAVQREERMGAMFNRDQ